MEAQNRRAINIISQIVLIYNALFTFKVYKSTQSLLEERNALDEGLHGALQVLARLRRHLKVRHAVILGPFERLVIIDL